ncbi:MAG TPA: hypothetical protein VEB21_12050, partial [Terriglobales bacterium]|nr:hypothetical protein [Terriglobales bacterium]
MVVAILRATLLVMLLASPLAAAPSLELGALQQTRRPDRFTAIPVWEPVWWVTLAAGSGGTPLQRVEYRASFADSTTRPTAGSWQVRGSDRDGFRGRARVLCDRLTDYDASVRVHMRVVDAAGESSDWVSVELPPRGERSTQLGEPAPLATAAARAEAEPRKNIGTVRYIAPDSLSLGEVRAELTRQAQAQGGTGIADLQLEALPDGRNRFSATV